MVTKKETSCSKKTSNTKCILFYASYVSTAGKKLKKLKFAENMAYNKKSLQKMNPIKYTN